jgi:hypothetical protein
VPPALFRRPDPEPEPPALEVSHEKIVQAVLAAMVSLGTAGILYIAGVINSLPKIHAEIDGQQKLQDARMDQLRDTDARQVGVLEKHERRIDNIETRLGRLESHE